MGCASSITTPYTQEETDAELAKFVPLLPVAELTGGMIKFRGANGFFNPNGIIDSNWLQGRISMEECTNAIDYINRRTAYTQIGLRKLCTPSDLKIREQMRLNAGKGAVDDLNKRYSLIKFNYQPTAEIIQINMSYTTDPTIQAIGRMRPIVANATVTLLYISFP